MKNMKTALALERLLPPGMDKDRIKSITFGCLACAGVVSLSFYMQYFGKLRNLYYDGYIDKTNIIKGAVMPDFAPMAMGSLSLFFLLAVCMPALAVYFYKYYYMGTKSIYTMRRLPQRGEILKRTLTVPAALFFIILLSAFFVMVIEFAVYMLVTPEQCISPDQWQKIWR